MPRSKTVACWFGRLLGVGLGLTACDADTPNRTAVDAVDAVATDDAGATLAPVVDTIDAGIPDADMPDAAVTRPCPGVTCPDVTIDGNVNLATDNLDGRLCDDGGEAVAYSVTALADSAATLAATVSAGCIVAGDRVLLLDLQGTAATANVGSYEILTVASVTGDTVTFTTKKTRFYGDGTSDDTNIGGSTTNQRVALQRLPDWNDVTITSRATVTTAAWNGTSGGVLAFAATGAVVVAGTIDASGLGYRGGARTTVESSTGSAGESYGGDDGASVQDALLGGGGGGAGEDCASYGVAGGGGGYATPGARAVAVLDTCAGAGGSAYGSASLTSLLLGSGGGSGGTDNYLGDNPYGGKGGNGGGIVLLFGSSFRIDGAIRADGTSGEGDPADNLCPEGGSSTTSCWDYSGPGGGGSGGSVRLVSASVVGTPSVAGGAGGYGEDGSAGSGGAGADGRFLGGL